MFLLALLALAPLQFHVDAPEYVNAVYNVGCLAERIACTKQVYLKFWSETLKTTREDSAKLDEFRTIFGQLEGSAGKIQPAPFLPNYRSDFPGSWIRVRLMAALLESKSPPEARRRAAAIASPRQADRLSKILEHFEKRLHPWWVATGKGIAQRGVKGVERQMAQLGLPRLAGEVAAFFELRDTARDLYLHAVPSPDYAGKEASAYPTLNHFCVELTEEINMDTMASVALHELTHSLYELAPSARKLVLMRQFVDSSDAASQPLYMYLNEAVASGVQQLLQERNGKKGEVSYHELFIPRLSQAAAPLIRQAIERKTSLFDGFAGPYIDAGRRVLGADADKARFKFSSAALLGSKPLRALFLEQFPLLSSVDSKEDHALFAELNEVRLATFRDAGSLPKEIEGLEEKMRGRGFAYVRRRSEKSLALYLIGRDEAAVGDLAKQAAIRPGPVPEGLFFTLD